MEELVAYLAELSSQLESMEAQIKSVREKMARATPDGGAAMLRFAEQWVAAATQARRKLAALGQEGDGWREHRGATDEAWTELRAIVESAKAAF